MLRDEIIQIIQEWAEDNLQLVRCENIIQLGYDKKFLFITVAHLMSLQ